MPAINGVDIPRQLYWACTDPAPLGGMRNPERGAPPWMQLFNAGFHSVVNLLTTVPPYDPYPLEIAVALPLQDLVGGEVPAAPETESRRIQETAHHIYCSLVEEHKGVLIHCESGTGRTGTVMGAVLKLCGWETDRVLTALNRIHQERGKGGWPESQWQAELVERMPAGVSEG